MSSSQESHSFRDGQFLHVSTILKSSLQNGVRIRLSGIDCLSGRNKLARCHDDSIRVHLPIANEVVERLVQLQELVVVYSSLTAPSPTQRTIKKQRHRSGHSGEEDGIEEEQGVHRMIGVHKTGELAYSSTRPLSPTLRNPTRLVHLLLLLTVVRQQRQRELGVGVNVVLALHNTIAIPEFIQ